MSEDTPEQEKDAELARVRKLVDSLGEHWENIQVFANRFDQDDTTCLHLGKGNIHARTNQVRSWLAREDALNLREDLREKDPPE